MRFTFRNLLFLTLILLSSISFAEGPKCSALFGPDIETLLEKAGQIEFDLNRSLTLKHNTSEASNDVQRLEQVQTIIEEILDFNGSDNDLLVLANRLDQISQKVEVIQVFSSSDVQRPTKVVEAKSARKDYEMIQHYLKDKYNKFLDEVSRVHSLAELPSNWALERINVFEVTHEPSFSVRLNQGYRVLFIYRPESGVKVLRISMKVTH